MIVTLDGATNISDLDHHNGLCLLFPVNTFSV